MTDAILNRPAFETQQTILEYLPKKAKIRILIEYPNPTFINETRIEGIKIKKPQPNDYKWIMNQRYKIWTPQVVDDK